MHGPSGQLAECVAVLARALQPRACWCSCSSREAISTLAWWYGLEARTTKLFPTVSLPLKERCRSKSVVCERSGLLPVVSTGFDADDSPRSESHHGVHVPMHQRVAEVESESCAGRKERAERDRD